MAMTDVALQAGTPEIPDKLYFKIGEVSDLLGVEPYVLRYWETRIPGAVAEEIGHRPPSLPPQRCGVAAAHQAPALRKAVHHRRRAASLQTEAKAPKTQAPSRRSRNCSPTIRYPKSAGN